MTFLVDCNTGLPIGYSHHLNKGDSCISQTFMYIIQIQNQNFNQYNISIHVYHINLS